MIKLNTFDSRETWQEAFLSIVKDIASNAKKEGKKIIDLCLAGGSTPESLYRALAENDLEGIEARLWLGDERAVAHKDPASNFKLIQSCFSKANWARVYPWPQATNKSMAILACLQYTKELTTRLGELPSFDLAIQGIGDDGHTASLFPGDSILFEEKKLAYISKAPSKPNLRMSLTYPILKNSKKIIFIAKGKAKKNLIESLSTSAIDKTKWPASELSSEKTEILYCLD